jgi:hypothetical protein
MKTMLKQLPRFWSGAPVLLIFSIPMFSGLISAAQKPSQSPRKAADVRLKSLSGNNLKPEDPTRAILDAFEKYEVVGMDAAHGNKDIDDLILHLLRDPGLPGKVNDIVVECGNSLYQSILDRYIAGDDVPLSEVRRVWRDTTVTMCSVSGFYEILFPLVRRVNQKLPPEKRLRVLAGDPPLDWSKVKDQSQVMLDRDASVASVMEKEVLAKQRKALMLFGTMHLFHSNKTAPRGLESAVERYEVNYPGVTFVIGTAIVSRNPIPPPVIEEMIYRMASWPAPSLVQNLKGTWLAGVDKYYFSEMVDAYLYLGSSDLILAEPRQAEIFLNREYMGELRRRAEIIGDKFLTNQADPDQVSDENFSPFLYGTLRNGPQSPAVILERPSTSALSPDKRGPDI